MKKNVILITLCITLFILLSSTLVFAPTASGIALCSPGKVRCSGKLIERCDSGGASYSTVEKCDSECKLDSDGKPYCLSDRSGGGQSALSIIGVLLAIIIFLIWLSRKFRNKRIYFFKQQKEEIKEKLMYCKHCGSKVSKGSKFCSECGKKS